MFLIPQSFFVGAILRLINKKRNRLNVSRRQSAPLTVNSGKKAFNPLDPANKPLDPVNKPLDPVNKPLDPANNGL